MDELRMLDDILIQLRDKTVENPLVKEDIIWYAGHLFTTNDRDRRTVLEKLIKDGYADRLDLPVSKDNPTLIDKYFITFEGLIFIRKRGYISEYRKELRKKWLDISKTIILILGSVISASYFSIQIWLFFCRLYTSSPL
ncbi:MAG: hypothetical protein DRJ01_15045 [Bacteroidetes bacterium]|nr:MAG: hypothetical protein DRJ01_15045 [Bacteroidota bacterium]